MPTVALKDGDLYYEISGEGMPLVLCRGLGRSHRYWLGFEKKFPEGFKLITFDNRGLGSTTAPLLWSHTMEDLADDLAALLDHLQIPAAHLFGLSLGGMQAMEFVARYPQRCLSLMVANSSSADTLGVRLSPKVILSLGRSLLRGNFQEKLQSLLTTKAINARLGSQIKKSWQEIIEEESFPWQTIAKQVLLSLPFKIARRIDGRQIPTMVVYGNQDQFVPRDNSYKIHKLIPHSQLVALRGVGHEISLGRPQQLVTIIEDFVKKNHR